MILSLLTTSFGFYFVSRLQEQLSKFFPISPPKKLFFALVTAIFLVLIFYFFFHRPLFLWSLVFLFCLLTEVCVIALKSLMERRLKETALEFIDHCCLATSAGNSFRSSVQKVFLQRNDWCAMQFKNLAQNLIATDKIVVLSPGFLSEFRQELTQIDRSGQKVNDQLKILRRILKIEINFRRKSGQVLRNLHIQSVVLTILYLSFVFFISSQVDLFKYKQLFIISISLFLTGLLLTFLAGRRLKWKV